MSLPLTQNERDARQSNTLFEMKDHYPKGALDMSSFERQRSLLKSVPSAATKWKFFPPMLRCNAASVNLLSLTALIRAPDGVYIPKSVGNPTSREKLKKKGGKLLRRYKQLCTVVHERMTTVLPFQGVFNASTQINFKDVVLFQFLSILLRRSGLT